MSEVVLYRGRRVKIGTCTDLYYTTHRAFLKAYEAGQLAHAEGNLEPRRYLGGEFRFRFPFPDEDADFTADFRTSEKRDFLRGLMVAIPKALADKWELSGCRAEGLVLIEITQQRLVREVDGLLATVIRCEGKTYWLTHEEARELAEVLSDNYVTGPQSFYAQVCARILEGYGTLYAFDAEGGATMEFVGFEEMAQRVKDAESRATLESFERAMKARGATFGSGSRIPRVPKASYFYGKGGRP